MDESLGSDSLTNSFGGNPQEIVRYMWTVSLRYPNILYSQNIECLLEGNSSLPNNKHIVQFSQRK